MGIAIGSDAFGRISPTFGLSGLFLHFQPSAYFIEILLAGSIWEGEVQGYKSKHSEKYDNFESCAHLIWQWNSYEMNFQPVK